MRVDVGPGRATLEDVQRAWLPLVEQSDQIADSITLTLLERDAAVYDQVGPDLRTDVRESTRVHIRRGLEVLTGRRPAGGSSAAQVWRETGRRRAQQGVPLELVLNAYTVGARMLWEALVAHSQRKDGRGDEPVLLLAARIVWSNLDVQTAVLIDAYRRESLRLTRVDLQRQQSVLDALVEGRGADPEYAAEVRDALGIDPDAPVGCLVALLDGEVDAGLEPSEDRLERLGLTVRWHVRGGTYFGLVAASSPGATGAAVSPLAEDLLVDVVGPQVRARVGVCVAPDGVAGFAAAYQLATRAAETMGRGTTGAVAVSQRLPEVLLAGSPQVAPLLLRETLGPLLAQPEAQSRTLLDTLAALLRHDGSPTHAAEELYCHRNTVIYRLKQIEELTGRSLASPRDKLLLELALMARDR